MEELLIPKPFCLIAKLTYITKQGPCDYDILINYYLAEYFACCCNS